VNHKRVYRLYRREGLMMRPKKPRRHVPCTKRIRRSLPTRRDESWSLDFMSDELFDGRRRPRRCCHGHQALLRYACWLWSH
jgi:putative transposase